MNKIKKLAESFGILAKLPYIDLVNTEIIIDLPFEFKESDRTRLESLGWQKLKSSDGLRYIFRG